MRFLLTGALLLCYLLGPAQVQSARLQASGLTCAMCSNSIQKALQTLDFVSSIDADLEQSAFIIQFKTGASVDFDALRRKVEGAGFSVARLDVQVLFSGQRLFSNQPVELGTLFLVLVGGKEELLHGLKSIRVVDKNFVLPKEFKKLETQIRAATYKTGTHEGRRVYHVTI
ncbi:MAG TPA: heavy-metal-associated domain-containing protein [Lacibacter sp.]|nr:heavy-metal-associated domain-containing protein [Lacibacter sp.]HMO89036.1 heavy-metal-associated domain-containing protein [Lacibacter sp.]HMP87117.1 heavy-metal-associated domain-containing protein [Lacibacter sp.]